MPRKLCSQLADPAGVTAFVAGCLIFLDKNPGIRSIGVGEVSRYIIGKAILRVVGSDIQEAAGSRQLYAGQLARCEAAVHVVRSMFSDPECEGHLLVDASNAFNSSNRQLALINISHLCPALSHVLINTYRSDTELFLDNDTILSSNGTTQRDPLAIAIYAIAMVLVIN